MTPSGQSPIDIRRDRLRPERLPPLAFDYPARADVSPCLNVVPGDLIDGRPRAVPLVVATPKPGAASLHVGAEPYRLLQCHWHTPAEHLLDGVAAPMELHLVHQCVNDDSLLVVAVFYEEGPPNDTLASLFDRLHGFRSAPCLDPLVVDLAWLLPAGRSSYRYSGSLTGADNYGLFREGVTWVVLADPVTASADQFAAHRALIDSGLVDLHFPGRDGFDLSRPNPPGNARPCQVLAGRPVLTDG